MIKAFCKLCGGKFKFNCMFCAGFVYGVITHVIAISSSIVSSNKMCLQRLTVNIQFIYSRYLELVHNPLLYTKCSLKQNWMNETLSQINNNRNITNIQFVRKYTIWNTITNTFKMQQVIEKQVKLFSEMQAKRWGGGPVRGLWTLWWGLT